MSSRQEQKERRRREREERERAEQQAARRKQLGGIVGGVVIVAAIIVGVVLAASGGGGGGGGGKVSDGAAPGTLPIPAQRVSALPAAVKAAGCAVRELDSQGQTHVDGPLKLSDYKSNPPTSGDHNAVPAEDGFYPNGSEPPPENWLHALEHGRVALQYKPGTPAADQRRLRTLFNEPTAGGPKRYQMLLFANDTGMKYRVAAVAWTRFVACNAINARTYDAIRAFRDKYAGKGPEAVP